MHINVYFIFFVLHFTAIYDLNNICKFIKNSKYVEFLTRFAAV